MMRIEEMETQKKKQKNFQNFGIFFIKLIFQKQKISKANISLFDFGNNV